METVCVPRHRWHVNIPPFLLFLLVFQVSLLNPFHFFFLALPTHLPINSVVSEQYVQSPKNVSLHFLDLVEEMERGPGAPHHWHPSCAESHLRSFLCRKEAQVTKWWWGAQIWPERPQLPPITPLEKSDLHTCCYRWQHTKLCPCPHCVHGNRTNSHSPGIWAVPIGMPWQFHCLPLLCRSYFTSALVAFSCLLLLGVFGAGCRCASRCEFY